MKKQLKDFLKYILMSGNKIAAMAAVPVVLATTTPVFAEEVSGTGIVKFEDEDIDAETILREQYGNHDYKTCDVSDVAKGQKYKTVRKQNFQTKDTPNIKITVEKPACKSVVYFTEQKGEIQFVRFQCEQSRFYNIGFAVQNDIFESKGACGAIKDVFRAINGKSK